jgi:hypothetical protein
MYDGWGRKFRYAVDPTATATSALPTTVASPCSNGTPTSITVNDASGAARTTAAVYALVSQGANGHGAYTSNGVTSSTGSVNANELVNCHCNSSGMATTYTPTYVEMVPTLDPNNALDNFDDIVTFKEAWQLQATNYPLSSTAPQCIYVVDSGNNRVEIFDTKGGYHAQFGSVGSGNSQFSGPGCIALDVKGNVYVCDYGNSRIEKFNAYGSYMSEIDGNHIKFARPTGIGFDPSGNIWLSDQSGYQIVEYNSSGNYVASFGSQGAGNGQFGANVSNLAVDASGNIFVADLSNNRIQKFNNSGGYLLQFGQAGPGGTNFAPVNLTIDASGNALVDDNQLVTYEKFDNNGNYLNQEIGSWGTGGGQFRQPGGVAVDSSGNIWVTSFNSNVEVYNSSGVYQFQFGSAGSGNGQFNTASGSVGGIAVGR